MKRISTSIIRSFILMLLATSLVFGLTVSLGTASAGAAPGTDLSAPTDAQPNPETYWTPERMASAVPYPLEVSGLNQPSSPRPSNGGKPGWMPSRPPDDFNGRIVFNGRAGTFPPPSPTGDNVTDYVPETDIHTFPYRAAGKVYFTMLGRNYTCSGSVIGENTIWTAGHCVSNGRGQFHSNWVFVPDFDNYTTIIPGPWLVSYYVAPVEFTRSMDLSYDYAIVSVRPPAGPYGANGKSIRSFVGALGFAWNMPRPQNWLLLGYPMITFNGANLVYSDSTYWSDNPLFNPASVGVGSVIKSGGSGGPWILNAAIGKAGQVNYLNGTNSYISPLVDEVFSPYLDDRAKELWDCSQGRSITFDWDCFEHSAGRNLTLTYDPVRDYARPGQQFTYRLRIQNPAGSAATNLVISDWGSFTILSAKIPGGACVITGSSVACSLARLPARSAVNVTLVVDATTSAAGDTIGNTATLKYDQLQKWDVQQSFQTDVRAGK